MPKQNNKPVTFEDISKQPVRNIPISSIQADSDTQTRITTMGTLGEQELAARQSKLVINEIVQSAKLDADWELPNPIMVAEVEGKRKLIDGHHRLHGFKAAGRKKIRAYVVQTSEDDWKRLALQANSVTQIVPEGRQEKLEKAWQLVKVGHNETQWISPTDNNSRVAKRHQVSRKTVIKMVEIRKQLNGDDQLARMGWHDAQMRFADFQDREFDEMAKRDPAVQGAQMAQDLIEKDLISGMVEGAWLLHALYILLNDESMPYGLTAEELVKYILDKHAGFDIKFPEVLVATQERF